MDFKLIYHPSTSPEPYLTQMLIMVDIQTMGSPLVDMCGEDWFWSGLRSSKLQPLVALSTTEAEHVSAIATRQSTSVICG